MGCRPASQVQQTAFHNAMDQHMPAEYHHRIAMFADDMAAGSDSIEELFDIYKALVIALDKAGIQVKASKVEFGVEEITFHNYMVIGGDGPLADTTTPKDETLDPIRSCTIPQTVTQLKAFLGSTQQMAQYVLYYALVASCTSSREKGKSSHQDRNGYPDLITTLRTTMYEALSWIGPSTYETRTTSVTSS